jgi:hypothetical protein
MGIFNGGVEKEFYPESKLAFGGFKVRYHFYSNE